MREIVCFACKESLWVKDEVFDGLHECLGHPNTYRAIHRSCGDNPKHRKSPPRTSTILSEGQIWSYYGTWIALNSLSIIDDSPNSEFMEG